MIEVWRLAMSTSSFVLNVDLVETSSYFDFDDFAISRPDGFVLENFSEGRFERMRLLDSA